MTAVAGNEAGDRAERPLRKRRPAKRLRLLAFPMLLAAGWGGLFLYTSAYVLNEPPRAAATVAEPAAVSEQVNAELQDGTALVGTAEAEVPLPPQLPEAPPAGSPAVPPLRWANADPNPTHNSVDAGSSQPIALAPTPAAKVPGVAPVRPMPAALAEPRSAFVGTWGPVSAACGIRGRRNGFIPATITLDGAKAGATRCSFSEHRRIANGWTVAASCSEGERQWSSQVRLTVEGDRLTWASEKGASRYVRCGRRTT